MASGDATLSARSPADWVRLHPEVLEALAAGQPVVALESTVITHGLPRPANLETARAMEAAVRQGGAVPATVAVLDGAVRVGLEGAALERLAGLREAIKINRRDLGPALAQRSSGGTTVSATMLAAHAAGIEVFATGGIGGVHRGGAGDVSADLVELARTPVAVVCAGAKAILDLPRTLEWLETAGVPVIGWGTDEFPAFFSRESGLPISARADSAQAIAAALRAHWSIGLQSGTLVCLPCPEEAALPRAQVERAVELALQAAAKAGVRGKDLTPFLLSRLVEETAGATLHANTALLLNNAGAAASLAGALARATA